MSDDRPNDDGEHPSSNRDLEDVDALMEQLRADPGVDVGAGAPRRRGRSPVVSLAVAAFGVYLLVTMWGDFRYWMQPREPLDLGHVGEILDQGRMPEGLDDLYVVVTGTPDVQHAARMSTKTRNVGYLRIIEAEGQLFAAIPRDKEEESLTSFEGRYEGRMRRLADTRAAQWLSQFFAQQRIAKVVDVSKEALVAGLGQGADARVATSEGEVALGAADRLRIVVEQPDATVQLGKTSFPRRLGADEVVVGLGYPWVRLDRKGTGFHTYVVRIPEGERDAAERKLNEGLDVPEGSADPKLGALVLPRTATYSTPLADVELRGETLAFPTGDNTTSPGYDVDGQTLKERTDGERLEVALSDVRAFRLERPIVVDPDAYIVEVGSKPSGQRQTALLWAVVLGVVGLNLVSPVLWWRRRAG